MGELLDEGARTIAAGASRRDVLKKLGGGLAAFVLAGLLPRGAAAQVVDPCGGRCLKTQCCNPLTGRCVAKCPNDRCCNRTTNVCDPDCPSGDCCDSVTGKCGPLGKCPGANGRPGCCLGTSQAPKSMCVVACPSGGACTNGACPCSAGS